MVKLPCCPSPEQMFAKYYLQHLTGVITPLPKIGEVVKQNFNRCRLFCKGLSRGERGSIMIVWLYVKDVAKNSLESKRDGVRNIVVSLVLNLSGKKEQERLGMLMPVNIEGLRMAAIVRLLGQLNAEVKNVLNVVQQKIYNSPILSPYGREVLTNG